METRAAELRMAIEKSRGGRSRWRCPEHLRSEVVALARDRQGSGGSLVEVAREVGISESGLTRWLQSGQESPLRRVRLVGSSPAATGLVLVTPRGYRVEGLDVRSAAELLRDL